MIVFRYNFYTFKRIVPLKYVQICEIFARFWKLLTGGSSAYFYDPKLVLYRCNYRRISS